MDNLCFKEEHKMIQKMVCDFAKDEIQPIVKELDKNGSFPLTASVTWTSKCTLPCDVLTLPKLVSNQKLLCLEI